MRRPYQADETLNVIVADTDWQTFEVLTGFNADYNLLNLSSDFAVSFIMENDHIDVILASKSIARIDDLKKKAERKKISMYILGQDAGYPVNKAEIFAILEYERNLKLQEINGNAKKKKGKILHRLFGKNNKSGGKVPANSSDESSITNPLPLRPETEDSAKNGDTGEFSAGSFSGKDLPDEGNKIHKTGQQTRLKAAGIQGQEGNKKKTAPEDSMYRGTDNLQEKFFSIPGKDPVKSVDHKNMARPLNSVIAIKQKIIVFIRAKGGVGSTLLSVYLASKLSNLKTLLVDLNFSEGGSDLGYYLEIPKTPNMVAFTEGYNRLSLNNSVINIKNNFDVLQPPPTYELAKKIDLQDIYSLVDVARKKYHLIIFDLPNRIDDIYLGVLDLADLAVMISDFSRGSIGRLADINNRFVYSDLEKILVLNRNNNGNGRHILKNGLKDFFGVKDIVSLRENNNLSGRSEFSKFNFESLEEFDPLTEKVMERLTCD